MTETIPNDVDNAAATTTTTTTVTADDNPFDLPPLEAVPGTSGTADGDDDKSDDTSSIPDIATSDDDEAVSAEEATGLLSRALALKEEGNAHFGKKGDPSERDQAVRCYRRGLQRLKRLRQGPPAEVDPQVATLHVTLATNLSTVLYQKQQYAASRAAASQALAQKPTHVKALYRRAVALRQLGDADAAKADLVAALAIDASHAPTRKEYKALQQSMRTAKEQQSKAMRKAFSAQLSLYDDKEAPAPPPTAEELLATHKLAWEDACVARMAKGEAAVTFADWQTEQEEAATAAKEAEKEKEKEKKADQKRRAAERKAKPQQADDSSSSEDDMTAAELQALRGYKKTKDGRVTSYFTREVADAVPATGPQKLNTNMSNDTTVTATSAVAAPKGPSAWNQAGTWEEKDCSNWCVDRLRSGLETLRTDSCRITKVDEVTGDASIVWASGQQRHLFDIHAILHYTWTDSEAAADAKACKGVVKLPEITSTSTLEGVEVVFEKWKRAPAQARLSQALADRQELAVALQEAVQAWLKDFHEHYKAV
jgi:hypothetical protein